MLRKAFLEFRAEKGKADCKADYIIRISFSEVCETLFTFVDYLSNLK